MLKNVAIKAESVVHANEILNYLIANGGKVDGKRIVLEAGMYYVIDSHGDIWWMEYKPCTPYEILFMPVSLKNSPIHQVIEQPEPKKLYHRYSVSLVYIKYLPMDGGYGVKLLSSIIKAESEESALGAALVGYKKESEGYSLTTHSVTKIEDDK